MVNDRNFLLADAHPGSPLLSVANYAYEERAVPLQLHGVKRGLQVGCMNGTRVVRFSQAAPHAHIDGLEISEASVTIARQNVVEAGLGSTIFLGDITEPPDELQLNYYDLVYSLNNTLGYIPDAQKALDNMRALSTGKVVLSLFSDERFSNDTALAYFASMEIDPSSVVIENDTFYLPGTNDSHYAVRRFNREEVLDWGSEIKETPLGFYAILAASAE
jgi:SAM-dependent methyltransferase